MKKALSIFLALTVLTIVTSGSAVAAPVTFRLGHMSPLDSPFNFVAEEFKRQVEERSKGGILIDIYPASQLGSDRELLEGIQIGTIDMAVNTSSAMTNFVKVYGVLDLPYMFKTWNHAYDWLASPASDALFAESHSSRVHTLAMMPRGFRHTFNSLRPIKSPADMRGLKLRVVESSVYSDTFKAFGANPQQMAWGEVYTALQQKTIDGMENNYVTVFDYKMHEIQAYCAETRHMFGFAAININDNVFKKLTPQQQALLVMSAKKAGVAIGRKQQQEEQDYRKRVEAAGVTVSQVDVKAFAQLVQPIYDGFVKKFGDKHLKAIQALEK